MNCRTLIPALLLTILACASVAAATPCSIPDNGTGTIDLPPNCCHGWQGMMFITGGLPVGSTIDITTQLSDFTFVDEIPGGSLGGNMQSFQGILQLTMAGTGDLAGFNRSINLPTVCEIHTAARTPGDAVQTFAAEFFFMATDNLVGDPDFDQLTIAAGFALGMPSPGQTTLTRLPSGDFAVDSFFDITYRIDFIGAPGSNLDGLAGNTTDTQRFTMGELYVPGGCLLPDNGLGTIDLPPECPEGYTGHLHIEDGLPPGTTIEIESAIIDFHNIIRHFGGSLGGEVQEFSATLEMQMVGTGELEGYQRQILLPLSCEVHTAARVPGDPVQIFAMELVHLQGGMVGDPDFDFLEIRAGQSVGLPCPGGTTIVEKPGSQFAVDSFFDITYEIEFVGAPGSILDGTAGVTTYTDHFEMGGSVLSAVGKDALPSNFKLQGNFPNPFNPCTEIMFEVPRGGADLSLAVFDLRGNRIRSLFSGWQAEGYAVVGWDGTDDSGRAVASGVYYAVMDSPNSRASLKMALIK